jgi:hypothetical protein
MTNRFNPRNQVDDLQRRQAQARQETTPQGTRDQRRAQGERGPRHFATVEPARNFGTEFTEYLNGTMNNVWTDTYLNHTFTRPNPQTATETFTQTIQATPPGGLGLGTTFNVPIRGEELTNTINRIRQNLDEQLIRPVERRVFDQVRWNDPIPPVNPAAEIPIPPAFGQTTPGANGRQTNQSHLNRQRYQIGVRSRAKAEKFKERYLSAMVMGVPYSGQTFKYVINKDQGLGKWFIDDRACVAEICLETVRLVRITLPDFKITDPLPRNLLDKLVRFLWRQLGLKAIRYKNKTIVHTGRTGNVMKAGDTWEIKEAYFDSYIGSSKPEHSQIDLFDKLVTPSKYDFKTKAVIWENLNGKVFTWGTITTSPGVFYDLNRPTPTESATTEDSKT